MTHPFNHCALAESNKIKNQEKTSRRFAKSEINAIVMVLSGRNGFFLRV